MRIAMRAFMPARHGRSVPSSILIPALVAACGLAATAALAGDPSLTIDAADRDRLDGCDQVSIRFGTQGGSWETVRSSAKFSVPRAEAAPLRAVLAHSGGMRVQPWDGADYEVEACQAAAGKDEASARKILEQVRVDHHDGRVSEAGPEENRWTVFLIVRVPKDASVDLSARNGQIDVRGVTGTIVAHTTNGPIALENCGGDVRASAENGPIAASGGRGRHRLTTTNGPIALELTGKSWDGEGLTADSQNGPLALAIGADYRTGVIVEQKGGSPLVCHGGACHNAKRLSHDGHRTLVFGEKDPLIKLTTVNGPIAIGPPGGSKNKDVDDDAEDDDSETF